MQTIAAERILSKQRLYEICNNYPEWAKLPEDIKQTHIRRMERSIQNMAVKNGTQDGIVLNFQNKMFVDNYSVIFSKIAANLSDNSIIINGLITETIDPAAIATLTSVELNPEATRHIREVIKKRQNQKMQIKVSHDYECSKCHARESTSHKFQGRSADESENTGHECVKCHYTWVT